MLTETSVFASFLGIKVGLTFYILWWTFAVRELTMIMLLDGVTFSILLGILFVAVPYVKWNSYIKWVACFMVIFGHQFPFWRHTYRDYYVLSDGPLRISTYIGGIFTYVLWTFDACNCLGPRGGRGRS